MLEGSGTGVIAAEVAGPVIPITLKEPEEKRKPAGESEEEKVRSSPENLSPNSNFRPPSPTEPSNPPGRSKAGSD